MEKFGVCGIHIGNGVVIVEFWAGHIVISKITVVKVWSFLENKWSSPARISFGSNYAITREESKDFRKALVSAEVIAGLLDSEPAWGGWWSNPPLPKSLKDALIEQIEMEEIPVLDSCKKL